MTESGFQFHYPHNPVASSSTIPVMQIFCYARD